MDCRALGQPGPEDTLIAGTWWWPSSQQDRPSSASPHPCMKVGCDVGAAPSHCCLGEETLFPGQPFLGVSRWCHHLLSSLWDQCCLGGFGVPWTLQTQTPTFLPYCGLVE